MSPEPSVATAEPPEVTAVAMEHARRGVALQVALRTESTGVTHVRVTQTGFEESARWRRYYEVIGFGWERALASLKALLEP